ncbi:MAG: hypothetical protein HYV95_11070 [Opitutae bacterium]|nr:hypothetical protein [Opitutae bacterium]
MKFQTRAWIVLFLPVAALSAQNVPTAQIRHVPVLSGRIEGSVHALTAENIVLNGDAMIIGDLLVPGTPEVRLNGTVNYADTRDGSGNELPAGFSVTLNGGATLGHVVRRTDAAALPLVSPPQPPAGTRSVALDAGGQSPGDFATLRDLTLGTNIGQITVPAGAYGRFEAKPGGGFTLGVAGASIPAVYDFQNLTLAPGSTLQLDGPVVITLGGDFSPKTNIGGADHPGWLKLRFAGGGLQLAGNVFAFGALEAPAGALSLGGTAQFTGSVAADRLEMNGRSVLRVLILNQPPTVDLVVPAVGAVLPDNVDVAIFANAGDADGSVARVEFYDGATKLGETTASAADGSVFRLVARLAAGPHSLMARAIDDAGAATDSPARTITVQPGPLSLPVTADFESEEGYQPGPLHGQKGWAATSGVKIAPFTIGDSRQEVSIEGGTLPESLIGTFSARDVSPVFVDFLARPVAGAEPATSVVFASAAARVALVGDAPTAQLHAARADANGTVVWQNIGAPVPVDAQGKSVNWLRLSVREDYGAGKWDLYAGGRMVAADLAFTDPAIRAFTWFSAVGHPSVAAAFDNFYAGPENPIAGDADRDGMDDAWETAHGLNPSLNDRSADPDGDSLTNVQEYVLGTDPNTPTNPSDLDGNGLSDAWERQFFGHIGVDPTADPDGDGRSNLQEFQDGKNPLVADAPLTVRIESPSSGGVSAVGSNILISTAVAGGMGSVVKVEFFDGEARLGEIMSAPFQFLWTGAAEGQHEVYARATDGSGQTALSATVTVRVAAPLPVAIDFEIAEGFISGALNGQKGWSTSETVVLNSDSAWSGRMGVFLPASTTPVSVTKYFSKPDNQSIIFADFAASGKVAASAPEGLLFDLGGARVAMVKNGTFAEFYAFNGNGVGGGTWRHVEYNYQVYLNADGTLQWTPEFGLRFDFLAKKWDLTVDGLVVAADLGLVDNAIGYLDRFTLYGNATEPGMLDVLRVGFDNFSFSDVERDNMDDSWERGYGIDPALNDRDGDPDHDGLTNIHEFILGSDPNNPDTDGDGLSDGFEAQHGFDPLNYTSATDDDEDGISQIQEAINGTDPHDYYNGEAPVISVLSGTGNPTGEFVVFIHRSDGTPYPHAPVTFDVPADAASLAGNPDSTILSQSISMRADANGIARVYLRPVAASQ